MVKFSFLMLNTSPYKEALAFQELWFNRLVSLKSLHKPTNNVLIFLQHFPVYTIGKSGDLVNLKNSLAHTGAEFYETSRGGDVTFHGPGQLVAYPIFDLDVFGFGVKEYVKKLEDSIIDCLAIYGLKGERIEDANGVWIDAEGDNPRKICAIGLRVSKGITMHGLAFNVNTDLSYFEHIVPCGIEDKDVTSLEKELGAPQDYYKVCENLLACFQKNFD